MKRILKRLLGKSKAGRGVTVFPDDAFIVSYPRSGNTWMRFLVGNLLFARQSSTDFLNIENRIPDIYQNDNAALMKIGRPRVLKSHEPFDPRYKKVLYIVRNPVDVVVSYYYYMMQVRGIDREYPLQKFARRFLDGDLDSFGTWREHVTGWYGKRAGNGNVLFMRYEDMRSDTEDCLREVAEFLGIEASAEDLSNAVARSTGDRMLALEKEQASQWRPLKGAREDLHFVRSAAAGNAEGKKALPPDLAAMITDRWRELMGELGYC